MLELRGVGVTAGAFSLTDLSLEVRRGEYFVLLGPTGAGKTLLLELLCGLFAPRTGEVRWQGSDLLALPMEARPLAVVFQDLALFAHLTVAENIAFGPRVRGVHRRAREARTRALAARLGIEPLLERRVEGLSGGERQRVALARALAVEPALLLLDEPLSALDGVTRDRLREELKRLHASAEGALTVVHVTHDREEALYLADRIAVLLEGRLFPPVPPTALFRRPMDPAVATFLGLRNVLSVDEAEAGRVRVGPLWLPCAGADARTRAAWIRPEALRLQREAPASPSAPSLVSVIVEETVMLGPVSEVRCRAGELPLRVLLPDREAETLAPRTGESLHLLLLEGAVYAFP